MKKAFLFLAISITLCTAALSQEKPKPDFKEIAEKAKAVTDKELSKQIKDLQSVKNLNVDTVSVPDSAKYVKIKDRLFPVAAFTQSVPVFLSADAWGAVLEIINSRDYGKIPATTIGQIIQAIGQQLPRKEN